MNELFNKVKIAKSNVVTYCWEEYRFVQLRIMVRNVQALQVKIVLFRAHFLFPRNSISFPKNSLSILSELNG